MGAVLGLAQAVERAHEMSRGGTAVVLTNGCFDLLHVGHLRYLQKAKSLGDALFVAINDDEAVRKLKGKGRPFVPADERAEMVAGLVPVDYAFVFHETTAERLVREIRPDIYAKGGDWVEERLPETSVVRECGIRLVFIPMIPERSTTGLADKVRAGGIPANGR